MVGEQQGFMRESTKGREAVYYVAATWDSVCQREGDTHQVAPESTCSPDAEGSGSGAGLVSCIVSSQTADARSRTRTRTGHLCVLPFARSIELKV